MPLNHYLILLTPEIPVNQRDCNSITRQPAKVHILLSAKALRVILIYLPRLSLNTAIIALTESPLTGIKNNRHRFFI
ncbi:MAG: hypothetical protein HJJLKODD_01804 [Phycisphaerae bacterium]|nr:hypothetical protein [Phycisphaerae bacterium]